MLNKLRNSILTKVIFGFMGLFLLNISVDTNDFYPENIPEDLTINDQESIIEIVVEQVLGFENAISEYDDNDTNDYNSNVIAKMEFLKPFSESNDLSLDITESDKNNYPNYISFLTNGFQNIATPPPQV